MKNDMLYKPVADIKTIDLNKTALIEASAGTGKTYTIENLVIRLLTETDDIDIENILLVTFTEKATGELKMRIRQNLEKTQERLKSGHHPASNKVQNALDAFDAAPIFTIHGFCNSLLKDYAFENKMLFQRELINDKRLFDSALKEQIRTTWPKKYGRQLIDLLGISGFDGQKRQFTSTLLGLARNIYRPEANDTLLPDVQHLNLRHLIDDIKTHILSLRSLMILSDRFSDGYHQLNINARSKKAILRDVVLPLENKVSEFSQPHEDLYPLFDCLNKIKKKTFSGRQGIHCILPGKWLKKGDNSNVCPNLKAVVDTALIIDEKITQASCLFVINTIVQLQKDVARLKQENGWISYDDMLRHVKNAVCDDGNDKLARTIRSRYKIAFVDEFQDTDPTQWAIFKKIFINHHNTTNRVFLIGDPKQAIYGFRGADVHTYLEARNVVEHMASKGKANLYSLKNNYRSSKNLVETLNLIFGSGYWFPDINDKNRYDIGFSDAESPKEECMPERLINDASGTDVVNIVDVSEQPSAGAARQMLYAFIPGEIHRLVRNGNIQFQSKNGKIRHIGYDDIAVLVRGKSDFKYLEPHLKAQNIPYSYYKKPGLFQSEDAYYLNILFHGILRSENLSAVKKMFLTPFFNWKTPDLNKAEQLSPLHPVQQLLYKWNRLALARQWGRLFASILSDSGFQFRECTRPDWERVESNYQQIFDYLEIAAYEKQLDFRSLSALLDAYVNEEDHQFDGDDLHQIETQDPKVQVMTMHVSKGLEFPIVFIAGGFTSAASLYHHVYHVKDDTPSERAYQKVVDISKNTGKELSLKEKEDEDKRLYYVAFTRAMYKLYLPFYPEKRKSASNGPVCKFISRSLNTLLEPGRNADKSNLMDPLKVHKQPLHPTSAHPISQAEKEMDWQFSTPRDYRGRAIALSSFSSLNHLMSKDKVKIPVEYQTAGKDKEPDEVAGLTEDVLHEGADENTLPGGTGIGSMFHDIFEHIDFGGIPASLDDMMRSPAEMSIIDQFMSAYRIDAVWRGEIAKIIFNTLTMPVTITDRQLILKDLPAENRLHEVEFYYPLNGSPVIRGFVDLIFIHKGKFYIADWKSNIIKGGYDKASIEANMEASGYTLQYQLYTIATIRWLKKKMGNRFDPDRHFGGVFYFYIRGMTGENQGVFFKSFDNMPGLEKLTAQMADIAYEKI